MAATCRQATCPRIWLADDDDDFRGLVAEALTSDGYEVVEARDGVELLLLLDRAVEALEARPDVILADVCMPRLSGLGVLEHLKKTSLKPPVLLITGFFPESVAPLAKRLGAFGVLAKPCPMEQLRAAVTTAVWASRSNAAPLVGANQAHGGGR